MAFEIEIISDRRRAINGFLYVRSRDGSNGSNIGIAKKCAVKNVTQEPYYAIGVLILKKGRNESDYELHAPDQEETKAEKLSNLSDV